MLGRPNSEAVFLSLFLKGQVRAQEVSAANHQTPGQKVL
jgi:hypothetical protein